MPELGDERLWFDAVDAGRIPDGIDLAGAAACAGRAYVLVDVAEVDEVDDQLLDLIVELRRQLAAQVKQVERLGREAKTAKAAIRDVELLKVWTNEDGKKFVFADELWAALADVSNYGPAALLAASPKKAAPDA